MSMTTGEFYALASVLIVLIVATIIAYLVWYYYWRKRHGDGFHILHSLPEKHNQFIHSETPKFHFDNVEFTLPQPRERPYSYSEGFHDFNSTSNKPLDKSKKERNLSESNQSNPTSLQTTMGYLKPELYVDNESDVEFDEDGDLPNGNIGRIWFTIEYDKVSEKLIVNIDKIKNLQGRQQRGSMAITSGSNSCDPFLRLYLLPDEKRYLQSKMKRKSRNPKFSETFIFTMSHNLLVERTLRITVFDVDRFMRQSIIGHVLFPLDNIDLQTTECIFRDIEKLSQLSGNEGRLQIGMTFFPKFNKIAVSVIRGQKIGNDEIGKADSYIKVTYSILNKVHKVKKSSVQKNTSEPFFNETFEFKVEQHNMDVVCLNFEIYHTTGMVKQDKLLGTFMIGGSMCTRGRELEHWTNMMQKPQTVVKEWHDLKI